MLLREPEGTIGRQAKELTDEEVAYFLSPFKFKTKNLHHQDRALLCAMDNEGFLFSLGMGLGKTKLGLDIQSVLSQQEGTTQRMLVMCPAVVVQEWGRECEKHSYSTITLVEGGKQEKLDKLSKSKSDIVVASTDWIRTLYNQAKKDIQVKTILASLQDQFDILLIDESHTVQNANSKGFRLIQSYLMGIPRRYLMTGTPVGNNWTGIWTQYYIIDKGATYLPSYYKFLRTYFDEVQNNHYTFHILKKDKKAHFSRLFWNKNIRYSDSDCPDLPEQRYRTITLDMTPQQTTAYRRELKILQSDDPDATINPNTLMAITGGCGFPKSPKLDILEDLVRELCVGNNQQIIIWHWLIEEGKLIQKMLGAKFKELLVRPVRGEVSNAHKFMYLEEWRAGKCKVLVANPRSLGVGVNLKEAYTAIFYSNSPSLIDRQQAEKRIHRTGQRNNCLYIDLICNDTIDATISRALSNKKDAFIYLTRDNLA